MIKDQPVFEDEVFSFSKKFSEVRITRKPQGTFEMENQKGKNFFFVFSLL